MNTQTLEKKIWRRAGSLTFFLFLTILLFNLADQSMLSPLVNPLLRDFFQNTKSVLPLGWVTFTFTILSALSMMTAGIYADRASRKKICLAGCLIYGGFSTLTVFTPHGHAGYIFFFIARSLNGIGIGTIVPAIFSMVGDSVHPNRRATAFGHVSVALLVGRMAGFAVAGSFTGHWRMAYFVLGIINLTLAAGLLLTREPARGSQEQELRELIREGAEYRFRIQKKDIPFIRANRSNFWLIMNFIDAIPGAILIFLIFKYMKDVHNMEANAVNFVILGVVIFGALGAVSFGRLGDWGFHKDQRAKVLLALFCNSLPIVFMVIFLSAHFWIPDGASVSEALAVPGMWTLIASIVAAMFINQGVNPNWYSSLTDINLPEHRATMISLASIMDMLGNALGPLIASYVVSIWGLRAAMWSVLLFWGINIFFWIPVLFYIKGDLAHIHNELNKRAEEMKRYLRG